MTEKNWTTKTELAEVVQGRTRIERDDVLEVVDAYLAALADALADGRRVVIRGFGSIEPRELAERRIPHPVTGERVVAPARKGLLFKPSPNLVAHINGWDTEEEEADE